jgi:C1A family cysteine protease
MKGKKRTTRTKINDEDVAALPSAVDWRNHNAVTPVKNQAHCGSCWAFATSAILEGAEAIRTGQLNSFSEQLWVSCVKGVDDYGYISEPTPCCAGCNGGDYDASFSWAGNNTKNFILEADYKYQMVDGVCEYESKD